MVQKTHRSTAFESSQIQQLDLALAWRRTKADLQSERVFVRTPYEIELVEENLEDWLLQLQQKIQSGYRPSSTVIADVPKGNGAIRPGAILSPEDRTVYAGIVGALLPTIYVGLKWEQGTVDFAYQLSEQFDRTKWFTNSYTGWTEFRNAQLQRLADDDITHVVVSDLTGFYENIDLTILMSNLRTLGCDHDIVQLLQTCLYRWAPLPGRGIPQGYSASDILAKVYLNTIDRAMIDEGFDYIRYVDDMRVFCKGFADCKRALLFATQAFRRRGLNLQTSKTEMIVRDHAKVRIEGIYPIIEAVQERYRKEISQIVGSVDPYAPISKIEAQVNPDEAPIEVLKEVFNEYFIGKDARFNSTLFHYLLNRFGAQKDVSVVKFCIRQLYIRPQETQPVLDYLRVVGAHEEAYPGVLHFLNSQDNLYEYQKYQIFRWLGEAGVAPVPGLLALARQLTFDFSRPAYLRAVCRKLLQDHGTIADLDRLEASYVDMRDDLEAAQTLISLKRMDAGRRNAFYGRVEDDGVLRGRAVRLVRQGRV